MFEKDNKNQKITFTKNLRLDKARAIILHFEALLCPSLLPETPKIKIMTVKYGYLKGSDT
jgi:hypothetical protein